MVKKQNKTTRGISSGAVGQAQRVGIFGASGSGKTTKARKITTGLNRVIFFDPLGEWGRESGVKTFYDSEKLKKELIKNFSAGFRYSFVPTFGDEEEQLQQICSFLTYMQNGYGITHGAQMTLVVDELDTSFPVGSMQKNRKNSFGFLCCRGRHFGINIIGISQRMHIVDNIFRANCSSIYFFRHSEPADIDIGAKMLGVEWRDAFKKLNNFEYIFKSGEKIVKK